MTNHLDDPAVGGIVINHRDVTVRRTAEASIRFQADLLDAAGQAIVGTDRKGRILFWNKVATRMYGWTRDEVIGRFVQRIVPPIDSDPQMVEMSACIARGATWTGDLWTRCKDRTALEVFMTTTPVYDAAGAFVAVVGVSTDITERKLAESELARLALHDPLTDLPNRLLLVSRLDEYLQRREQHGDAVVVLFIDLDRFKVINDGIGHQTGDEVLRAAAQRLAAAFPDEFIARFGGDEFVLLHCEPNRIDTDALATRVHAVFDGAFAVNGYELFLTASVGVAHATDRDTSETLLRDADSAMYEAKDGGRSRTTVFDETLREHATRRLEWENSLRHALDRAEFRLVYQPVVSLADGTPVGFEALLRWDHPTLGSVSPADFIPVAEDTGSIVAIGAWVIDEAVRQLATWDRDRGTDDLWMTVNVSTRQLATPSLVGTIRAAFDRSGHRAGPPPPGDHGDRPDPRRRPVDQHAAGVAGHGCEVGDRRLRHRVLIAHVSQAVADRRVEDRPVVRRRARHRPERHVDRADDPESRVGTRPHCDRRGCRDRGPARRPPASTAASSGRATSGALGCRPTSSSRGSIAHRASPTIDDGRMNSSTRRYDVVVVGGGIVGLATAFALRRADPARRIAVVEKEAALGTHQSGNNSNVIHSGLYYAPGSLKANLAVQGNRETVAFCRRYDLPYEVCGKVVVATSVDELPRMAELARRGALNGVEVNELTVGRARSPRAACACDRGAARAVDRDLRLPARHRTTRHAARRVGRRHPDRTIRSTPSTAVATT